MDHYICKEQTIYMGIGKTIYPSVTSKWHNMSNMYTNNTFWQCCERNWYVRTPECKGNGKCETLMALWQNVYMYERVWGGNCLRENLKEKKKRDAFPFKWIIQQTQCFKWPHPAELMSAWGALSPHYFTKRAVCSVAQKEKPSLKGSRKAYFKTLRLLLLLQST